MRAYAHKITRLSHEYTLADASERLAIILATWNEEHDAGRQWMTQSRADHARAMLEEAIRAMGEGGYGEL